MQSFYSVLLVSVLFAGCRGNEASITTVMDTTRKSSPVAVETGNSLSDTLPSTTSKKLKLALAANSLQTVDAVTGSTREITFGMPFDQLVEIVGRILEGQPNNVGVNTECGAGPLKMANWPNGLTLVFQEKKKGDGKWLFAGWLAGKPTGTGDKPITMSGVGVGSTLEELENVYITTVTKTTLGDEFSIKSGFYGLLSGNSKKATIEVMWSGASCNFR